MLLPQRIHQLEEVMDIWCKDAHEYYETKLSKAEDDAATSNMQHREKVAINVLATSAKPGLTCCPF